MIEKFALGAKILVFVLAGFFVLMSIDVFEMEDYNVFQLIGVFLISISPALILVGVMVIFWKKEKLLAFMFFGIALAWTIFLIFRGNFPAMFGGLLIVDLPLVISGTILLISSKKLKE